ncbi:hypothetical protein FA13DRAFT_1738896 [Coprinellus micaceus]|uniref:BTB domain-containing protein n=1 Tax=Coprinellus micaceus TaxID=71717 RepID=A0A4Y7ST46_COPMI|nr:hypothetical protein FA13DRAFT_1738896 [Coprinellus micaceus]
MPGTDSDSAPAKTPPKFQWEIVIFKVGDRLFRVARQELAKESPVFESMFSLPNSGEAVKVEGQTDDNPIHLNGYKPEEFEALLTLLYPTFDDLIRGSIDLTKPQWIGVLKLSTMWEIEKIRQHAILTLSADPFSLTPTEKVKLAREHRVGSWLEEGLVSLVKGNADLSLDALEAAVGLRTAYRIVGLRAEAGVCCNTLLPKLVSGAFHPTLPLGHLRCMSCSGFVFQDSLRCPHSQCRADIALDEEGGGYVRSSSDSLVKSNSSAVFYEIELRDLMCASCSKGIIRQAISCASCERGIQTTEHVMFPLRSVASPSFARSMAVREVFADELEELAR